MTDAINKEGYKKRMYKTQTLPRRCLHIAYRIGEDIQLTQTKFQYCKTKRTTSQCLMDALIRFPAVCEIRESRRKKSASLFTSELDSCVIMYYY
jgi:hypothetical protein